MASIDTIDLVKLESILLGGDVFQGDERNKRRGADGSSKGSWNSLIMKSALF